MPDHLVCFARPAYRRCSLSCQFENEVTRRGTLSRGPAVAQIRVSAPMAEATATDSNSSSSGA